MLNMLISIVKKKPVLTIMLLYSSVVIITSWHHEVWRDEVRALSQAVESQSVWELMRNKQAEGHPALWYMMLYFGYKIFHAPQILKILSVTVAILAMYIFVSRSPFSWQLKVLFAFAYFPLYEYSVISRNYGISMPLLFGICCLYPKRFEKIIPIGIMLFLLAHTNAYSTIISISFGLSLMIEAFVRNKELVNMNVSRTKLLFVLALSFMGLVLFVLYMKPYHWLSSSIFGEFPIFVRTKSLVRSIFFPGLYFNQALGFRNWVFASLVIWTLSVYLLRKPFIFLIFFLSVVGIGLFHEWFSAPLLIRHQGLLVSLVVVVLWLDRMEIRTQNYPNLLGNLTRRFSFDMNLFLSVLMVMQVCVAGMVVKGEIFGWEYSSSKSFGNLIIRRPDFREAIIVGEPDFLMESLPYYVDNQIYMARERRFKKYVDWGHKKRELSLNELLKIAITLETEYDKPILLAIGHRLNENGPFKINYGYDKLFTYDSVSLKEFYKHTSKVTSFRQSKLEKYDVFLLE